MTTLWAANAELKATGSHCASRSVLPSDDDRAGSSRTRRMLSLMLALAISFFAVECSAESYEEPFESAIRSWVLTINAPRHLLVEHRRQKQEAHSGRQAEFLRFDSPGREKPFGLVHTVPKTPVFNELTASVWVKSGSPGVELSFRIVCPNAIDPEYGHAVAFRLVGDRYAKAGQWQQLKCVTSDATIRERHTRLRAELIAAGAQPDIDLTQMYVDKVELRLPLQPGVTGLLIDDLKFGPLVKMQLPSNVDTATGPSIAERLPGPLDLSGGHARLNGHPWVSRMAPYHGEPTDLLRKLQFNVVWLDRKSQWDLLETMQAAGLWVSTSPPMEEPIAGASPSEQWSQSRTANSVAQVSANAQAILNNAAVDDGSSGGTNVMSAPSTIGAGSEAILFWNLGARIPPSELPRVERAVQSIRQSDRLYEYPRPVVADVVSHDRRFSRQLDVTGSSVPLVHTATSPRDYFATLRQRAKNTLAGSPKSTWVATEASPAMRAAVESSEQLAVVEPEQIMLQADLALAAGYQGINYWSRTSLAGNRPGDAERRAAIELANRQIDLLEAWTATGEFVGVVPVSIVNPNSGRPVSAPIVAAISRSELGTLVRLVWIGDDDQYVPGPMAAANLRIVVPGAGEMPVAYEITTTNIRAIDPRPVAGGTEIILSDFDQSASIIITGFRYQGLIERLRKRVLETKEEAAGAWVRLASSKHDRVVETHDRIQAISPRPIAAGAVLISESSLHLERARDALEAEDFDLARQESRFALDQLRRLQRSHWEVATRRLTTPHSDVHALCFDTLPMFWAERRRMVGSEVTAVPLESGDFEDGSQMRAEGWNNIAIADSELQGRVDLATCDDSGGRSIRLAAADVDGAEPNAVRASIETPAFFATPGAVAELTVRVRSYEGRKPGALQISDNRLGPVVGLRHRVPIGRWETVSVTRPVGPSGEIRFRFDLLGSGVACLDDVAVRLFQPPNDEVATVVAPQETAPDEKKRRGPRIFARPLEALPSIPKLPDFTSWRWERDEGGAADGSSSVEGSSATGVADDGNRFDGNWDDVSESKTDQTDTPLVLPTIRPGHGI